MKNSFSPAVSNLEDRALQTVISLSNGVLSVFGTPDEFSHTQVSEFSETQIVVFHDEDTSFFNTSEVTSIKFYSSAEGNDVFINDTNIYSEGYLQGVDNVFVDGFAYGMVVDWSINSFVDDNGGGLDYHDMVV